jgi:hypothetical protein
MLRGARLSRPVGQEVRDYGAALRHLAYGATTGTSRRPPGGVKSARAVLRSDCGSDVEF